MNEVCNNCKFWVKLFADEYIGQCRRNPPITNLRENHYGIVVPNSEWPATKDDDFCGEFRKKE